MDATRLVRSSAKPWAITSTSYSRFAFCRRRSARAWANWSSNRRALGRRWNSARIQTKLICFAASRRNLFEAKSSSQRGGSEAILRCFIVSPDKMDVPRSSKGANQSRFPLISFPNKGWRSAYDRKSESSGSRSSGNENTENLIPTPGASRSARDPLLASRQVIQSEIVLLEMNVYPVRKEGDAGG